MSKLIITTVGISIISNQLYDSRFKNEITELVEKGTKLRNYDEIVDNTVTCILGNLRNLRNDRLNKQLSAELASLMVFKENSELGISADDIIALFSTDTEDGKFCAKVNEKVLNSLEWCRILEPVTIEGLKTKRITEDEDISGRFKDAGLIKLKEETEKLLRGQSNTQKYFNITGGFKATIPFITILAFEKGISLFYLYEESTDLIIISPPRSGSISSYDELISLTSQLGPLGG